jgi:hypothetical protein
MWLFSARPGNADAQVSEMAAAIDRRMPAPFDVRKANPETFKRVRRLKPKLSVPDTVD